MLRLVLQRKWTWWLALHTTVWK